MIYAKRRQLAALTEVRVSLLETECLGPHHIQVLHPDDVTVTVLEVGPLGADNVMKMKSP